MKNIFIIFIFFSFINGHFYNFLLENSFRKINFRGNSLNLKEITIFKQELFFQSNCIYIRTVSQNINMKDCLISMISSESGGAIYISGGYNLNINDTTFFDCFSLRDGGAIWFQNGLNPQLFRICALYCRTSSEYNFQFSYFSTIYSQVFDLISISKCNNNTIGYTTLTIQSENQNLFNSNISYNNNIRISGIYFYNPVNMLNNFCTFYNNTVRDYWCIYLQFNTVTISKSNIILNNTNYGVVFVTNSGNYILNECFFDKNKDILLFVDSGTLELINCYYLTGSFSTSGLVSNTLIHSITHIYQHSTYFTYYCSINNISSIFSKRNNQKSPIYILLFFFLNFSIKL